MQTEQVLDIARQALKVAMLLSAPVLLFGLVTGVLVNVFQAATQITETTLSFIPKILAIGLALALFAPWMTDLMADFTAELFANIPNFIR